MWKPSLPSTLKEYRGLHANETMLVCGCGSSLNEVVAPERYTSIGVNDVGRLFHPDYLLVLNGKAEFRGDRFHFVETTRARAVFTQLKPQFAHPHIVRFPLGRKGGTDFGDPNVLHYTRNSPYVALCLAAHMGARRIGLIGVDFTDHHFFARTGQHTLTPDLPRINEEYRQLYERMRELGIEVFNLSAQSRLTALPKMTPEQFACPLPPAVPPKKLFFVNYEFVAGGSVFTEGLARAASDLNLPHDGAQWNDRTLRDRARDFQPDMAMVVHGHCFGGRTHVALPGVKQAVWLLDEPYLVDGSSQFSGRYDAVFVNDRSVLRRHPRAHYLPVCYDPHQHHYRAGAPRRHGVGFIGHPFPFRERCLTPLAQQGLLSYVIGNGWRTPELRALLMANKVPPQETANLYRDTKIVINVFREVHQMNRGSVPAYSMNPRIYEALACGALVVSDGRDEIADVCPEMPVFDDPAELPALVDGLLRDEARLEALRRACIRRLAHHTYSERLRNAVATTFAIADVVRDAPITRVPMVAKPAPPPPPPPRIHRPAVPVPLPEPLSAAWELAAGVQLTADNGTFLLSMPSNNRPGGERGLSSRQSFSAVELACDVYREPGATLVLKVRAQDQWNTFANSYHLIAADTRGFIARHNQVLATVQLPAGVWTPLRFSASAGKLTLQLDGVNVADLTDPLLPRGHCFVGLQGGTIRIRNLALRELTAPNVPVAAPAFSGPPFQVLLNNAVPQPPLVTIVTPVFDRVECLDRCIRSVQHLELRDYEHIVVADAPPPPLLQRLHETVAMRNSEDGRLSFSTLARRSNNWGIAPAWAGLSQARGKYVAFLSDDNGYLPQHFASLVESLENNQDLGFVYSSCLYDGRKVLRTSPPRAGAIDLGQPLFRRELFTQLLNGRLPFNEYMWDWRMIEHFLRRGVRWQHVDQETFIFRLARYPAYVPDG